MPHVDGAELGIPNMRGSNVVKLIARRDRYLDVSDALGRRPVQRGAGLERRLGHCDLACDRKCVHVVAR
jgi:hypothetical protein